MLFLRVGVFRFDSAVYPNERVRERYGEKTIFEVLSISSLSDIRDAESLDSNVEFETLPVLATEIVIEKSFLTV